MARGHPLELLKAKGDLQSAELSDIYRQQAKEDKKWVQSLRETPAQALEAARKDGRITELALEDGDDVNLVAAEKGARGVREAREAGKSTLTICPTHALGITVSKVVRAELQRAGLVQKDKVEVTVRKAIVPGTEHWSCIKGLSRSDSGFELVRGSVRWSMTRPLRSAFGMIVDASILASSKTRFIC